VTVVTPSLRLHRAAGVAALRAPGALPGTAGQRIGTGKAPDPPPGQPQPATPYGVFYGLPSTTSGPADDEQSAADIEYVAQVKCVGATEDEADGFADAVARVLLDPAAWAVPGRSASKPSLDLLRPAVQDPQLSPPRYAADVIVRVFTSPA
jgi:hypothetical protein